jgi:hypothetical protein
MKIWGGNWSINRQSRVSRENGANASLKKISPRSRNSSFGNCSAVSVSGKEVTATFGTFLEPFGTFWS